MKAFRDLKVWQKGHELALAVYAATKAFPKEELYGLTSQIRRSAASVPANIAEGCGRYRDNELARFLQIAMGSASETEYHLLLARDLGFLGDEEHKALEEKVREVKKMLSSFLGKLRTQNRHLTADR